MNRTAAGSEREALLMEQIKMLQQQIADMNDYIDSLERRCWCDGGGRHYPLEQEEDKP